MTGNQLKYEIKKLNITQDEAAKKLGITRQTLGMWLKYAELDNMTMQLVTAKLGISETSTFLDKAGDLPKVIAELTELNKSQQRTIESLSKTIENLTSK